MRTFYEKWAGTSKERRRWAAETIRRDKGLAAKVIFIEVRQHDRRYGHGHGHGGGRRDASRCESLSLPWSQVIVNSATLLERNLRAKVRHEMRMRADAELFAGLGPRRASGLELGLGIWAWVRGCGDVCV